MTLLLGSEPGHAAPSAFQRCYVFGDSLSDTGNFHALTGGYPPAPYFNGRFSNGPLWIERLAETLRVEVQPGDNYAVGGATTGRENGNDGLFGLTFPGLHDQIDAFEARSGGDDHSRSLFVVWAGANDFFVALQNGTPPGQLIGEGVANTVQAIVRLRQSGARHILVLNVPDLGLTPYALEAGLSAPVTQLCGAYNQALTGALDSLAAAGVPTIRVDAFATLRAMVEEAETFGFANVTQGFLATGGNPEGYLFWDQVHPTTRGHAVLAESAATSLLDWFSPGHSPSPRGIQALHGLVISQNK